MTNGNTALTWQPPALFDPEKGGLGLPQLEGVEHMLLYDPLPSQCEVDCGGDDRYWGRL
ncbi:MAG: hypothetical protein R6V03_02925 [Kiritimatiellia bacterium]